MNYLKQSSLRASLLFSLTLALILGGCGGGEEEASTEGPSEGTTTAPATPADTSLPGNAEAGAAVYASHCVACHAADGRGNGGMTGADFVGDSSRLAKDNAVLIRSITDGVLDASPAMPPHGTMLDETQIRDVLSYVRREFGSN